MKNSQQKITEHSRWYEFHILFLSIKKVAFFIQIICIANSIVWKYTETCREKKSAKFYAHRCKRSSTSCATEEKCVGATFSSAWNTFAKCIGSVWNGDFCIGFYNLNNCIRQNWIFNFRLNVKEERIKIDFIRIFNLNYRKQWNMMGNMSTKNCVKLLQVGCTEQGISWQCDFDWRTPLRWQCKLKQIFMFIEQKLRTGKMGTFCKALKAFWWKI